MKMGDITEKRLSKLSRGIGTHSGNLVRETPVYRHESSDEYGLFRDNSEESLKDLFLLRINGTNAVHQNSNVRNERIEREDDFVHKTYSTKLGTLILYADSLYLKEKRKKKIVKKKRKTEFEEIDFEGTVEELADCILRFGNENIKFFANEKGLRDERIISVRPGYSPVRYIASVSKLWKPGQVEKLVEEKALKEDNIQRYHKIKLPKIDVVPSSDYDPLLRDRPKPYSHFSLPELLMKREPAPSRASNVPEMEERGDGVSSGYAKSLLSEKKAVERRKLIRKKTMQMKKLELHLPNEAPANKSSRLEETFEEENASDDDTNDSFSDWERRVQTTRNVVDRTFENLVREKSKEIMEKTRKKEENQEGIEIDLGAKQESSLSSSADFDEEAMKEMEYALLNQKQKEELISQLLLQGIVNEASTVESLISVENDEKASLYSENKIDLSEQISFPSIIKGPTLPSLDKTKGFKGKALHGSLPSAKSNKSKQSSKSGSIKDSLFISSVGKLPPIKSEPVTPNVNEAKTGDADRTGVKLPAILKRPFVNSHVRSKSSFDSEADRDSLFIGGRAIEVTDVHVQLKEGKSEMEDSDGDYDDDDDGEDLIKVLRDKEAEKDELLKRYEEENVTSSSIASNEDDNIRQSPDSGLSTATGLTLASDTNPAQNEQKALKERMTPVAEESSRSSKASKTLSREGTVNRTSSSIRRLDETRTTDSSKKKRGSGISSGLKNKEDDLIEEKSDRSESSFSRRSKEENLAVSREITIDVDNQHREVSSRSDEEGRSVNANKIEYDTDAVSLTSEHARTEINDRTSVAAEDEGVYMEEEKQPLIQPEATDVSKDNLVREDSDTKTLSDSVDISIKGEGRFDDSKTETGSIISRRSSGLLLAQARAAAHSALSRPKSGLDLIEDMKIAANEFGKLFGEQMQKETNGVIQRGRTHSEAIQPTRSKRGPDKKRSMSSLSTNTAKKLGPVDIDALKATFTSYQPLNDKTKDKDNIDQRSLPTDEKLDKESAATLEDTRDSLKSFPAASLKSQPSLKASSPKDIQMDIISYAPLESNETQKEALIQREVDAVDHGTSIVREKTVDTEEERFEQALKAIVEEVKDLKEKKPSKKKKGRKSGPASDEKNHIVRDVTPASPPFRTGRVKDEKAPKGLDNKENKESKSQGKKGKVKKESTKKVKTKKEKQLKKKVTFGKEIDDRKKEKENIATESNDVKIAPKEEEYKEEPDEEKPNAYDKYDVPITIKPATKKSDSGAEEEESRAPAEEILEEEKEDEGAITMVEEEHDKTLPDVTKGESFISSTGFETDEYAALSSNDNDEGGDHKKRMDDRMQRRKMEAERRRLKVEQKRREKEEAKRKQQEQAEREEKMKQEAELEMQRRMEEVKNRKKMEEEEKRRKEEEEKRRERKLEREREREKREKEEMKRKMAAIAEKLRLEEEQRREEERLAREIEEELKRQEEEMLKAMEEHERIEYERKKKEEEEERLRQEEERKRLERERRLIEEEEHRIKMQKLQEFHQMLLERAKFWEGMKNSKWFLEISQRLTRAFTFSYFDLLPAILFEFTSLRPFTPKENKFGVLPTIHEEKKEDKS